MGERVMADVMQQRRELDLQLFGDTTGKMVRTQRVLKPGVRGARVHEKCVTELPDVPETLERRRIDDGERLGLEADVVPQRVANDLELTQVFGPASRTLTGTSSANCSKFFRKRAVSFFAWTSYAAGSFHVARGSSSSSGTPGTCFGTANPKTGSCRVGTVSSSPANAARIIARVLFRSIRCPTPYGPPVQPVFTSQQWTVCRAIRSPSILA